MLGPDDFITWCLFTPVLILRNPLRKRCPRGFEETGTCSWWVRLMRTESYTSVVYYVRTYLWNILVVRV